MRPHDRAARVSGKAQSAGLDDLGSQPDLDIMDIIHDIPAIQVMGRWGGLSLDLPAGSSIETQTALKRYLQDMGNALGWSEPKVLAHSDKLGQIFDMPGDAAAEFAFQFNVAADEQRHSDEQNESAGKMIRIRKSDLIQILREVGAPEIPDASIRKTDKLSEEELTNMTPLEWTQMRNSENKARMSTTPDLFIGMLRADAKWLAQYNTAADLVKELTLSAISDIVKDERGTRPDLSAYRGMSVEELRDAESDALESLERSSAHEEEGWQSDIEDEEREATQSWHDEENTRLSGIEAEEERMRAPESEYEDTPTRQRSRRFEGKMKITRTQLRRIIREECNKLLNESVSRYSGIWKASNGRWYLDLADNEHGEYEDATTYGPFMSEDEAEDHLSGFSNPGGTDYDDSGTQSPPSESPDGSRVINPGRRSSHGSGYGGYGRRW